MGSEDIRTPTDGLAAVRDSGDSKSALERISSHVLLEIASSQYAPGARLPSERATAATLRVSRTAVRDAMKTLAGLGVVDVRRGSGTYIAGSAEFGSAHLLRQISLVALHDRETLRDFYELRKLLEVQAAGWAARRASPEHLEALERLRSSMEDALDTHDQEVASSHDTQVHSLIAAASGNRVLELVMENMRGMLAAARLYTSSIPGRTTQSYREHLAVLAAVLAGDEDGSRSAMYLHLDSVGQAVLAQLEEH